MIYEADDVMTRVNHTTLDEVRGVLILTSSSLSVVGACIIIISFLLVKSVRTPSRCIVVIMAIADIMVALPALLSEIVDMGNIHSLYNNRMCKIQSFCTTIGSELSFIWTAGLAQHMYLLVSTTSYKSRKSAMRCSFIVLCSLTVLVVAENIYCYQADILGSSQELGMKWCWINVMSNRENCNWMLYNGKILEIVMYVAVFIYYFLLYTKVNHLKSRRDIISSSLVTHLSKTGKIVAIPFVFVLVRLWGTLVTLWLVAGDCHRPADNNILFEMLLVMMSLFDLSQGWVNFVLYFLTTSSELRIMEKVKLVARSIPYMTKTRRQHSSENSCMTYNTSNGRRSHTASSIHTRTADSRTYSSSPVLANRTAVLFEQQDLAP